MPPEDAKPTSHTHALNGILEGEGSSDKFWSGLFGLATWRLPFRRLRLIVLESDFNTFHSVLLRLKSLGCREIPAVLMDKYEWVPSSPASRWLASSDDSTAGELRERWSGVLDGKSFLPDFDAIARGEEALRVPAIGEVVTVELGAAATTFSASMNAAIAAAANSSGLVQYTVYSQHSGWRVHFTEQYWYNPIVFGTGLSTPVTSRLAPANYRFGGDKGTGIKWDTGTHVVPAFVSSTTVTAF